MSFDNHKLQRINQQQQQSDDVLQVSSADDEILHFLHAQSELY